MRTLGRRIIDPIRRTASPPRRQPQPSCMPRPVLRAPISTTQAITRPSPVGRDPQIPGGSMGSGGISGLPGLTFPAPACSPPPARPVRCTDPLIGAAPPLASTPHRSAPGSQDLGDSSLFPRCSTLRSPGQDRTATKASYRRQRDRGAPVTRNELASRERFTPVQITTRSRVAGRRHRRHAGPGCGSDNNTTSETTSGGATTASSGATSAGSETTSASTDCPSGTLNAEGSGPEERLRRGSSPPITRSAPDVTINYNPSGSAPASSSSTPARSTLPAPTRPSRPRRRTASSRSTRPRSAATRRLEPAHGRRPDLRGLQTPRSTRWS